MATKTREIRAMYNAEKGELRLTLAADKATALLYLLERVGSQVYDNLPVGKRGWARTAGTETANVLFETLPKEWYDTIERN